MVEHNIRLLKSFREKFKEKLTKSTDMLDKIIEKNSEGSFEPFKAIGSTFTDGFSITDPILPISEFVDFLKSEFSIAIHSYVKSLHGKANNNKPVNYFIRIDDKEAIISEEFLTKLATAMDAYRKHLYHKLWEIKEKEV